MPDHDQGSLGHLLRVTERCRREWVGKDGIWAVYCETQENLIVARLDGVNAPEWLPGRIEGIDVVGQRYPLRREG